MKNGMRNDIILISKICYLVICEVAMKDINGILILPSSKTESAIKNILSIMFDANCLKKEKLPFVSKVLFIETDDSKYEGNYSELLSSLNLDNVEIRKKRVSCPVSEIPAIIMSAVREVGTEHIIMDLTCGMKDITGSLYTAATLSGIDNITYTSVKHQENNPRAFYDLSSIANKDEYYILKKYKSIGELTQLASLNCIDIIEYKKDILKIRQRLNGSGNIELLCLSLDSAIENYFTSSTASYYSCIQKIGVGNEFIVGLLSKSFISLFGRDDFDFHTNQPYENIRKCQEKYIKLSDKVRKNTITENEQALLNKLNEIFSYIPALYHFVTTLKIYRNRVSHEIATTFSKEDAKLCIEIYFKIINGLCQSNFNSDIFEISESEG